MKLSITATIIALVLIGTFLTLATFAALSASQNIPSSGVVITSANLGVFSDSGCTTSLSSINWGTLTPGGNITQTIYVKNTSVGLSLTLNMSASNWNPVSANGPVTVSWNQVGTRLQPGQSVEAVLTLMVSSNITDVTNFGVQINIIGTN